MINKTQPADAGAQPAPAIKPEALRIAALQAAPPAPAAVAVPLAWNPLPVIADERRMFDEATSVVFGHDVRAQLVRMLSIFASAHPRGSFGAQLAIMANEAAKLPLAAAQAQEHATQLAGLKPRTPGSFVNAAGTHASDKPATVVRKLDAAFHDAVTFADTPAQERTYICPVRTVADLVNNLLLMDQTLPIYGAQYIEHPAGKRRVITVPPTVSRERVKDRRWIGEGEELNAAVIWTRAEQPAAQEIKPLTEEQIQDLIGFGDPTEQECHLVRLGWDAAHNIETPR